MEGGGPARTRFPDIYREYESLQAQVKQAAQDYIVSPHAGATPLEVTNIEVRSFKEGHNNHSNHIRIVTWNTVLIQVARSLGILDEVNKMKVVPGASPAPSLPTKNVRYMEVKSLLN